MESNNKKEWAMAHFFLCIYALHNLTFAKKFGTIKKFENIILET